MPAAELVLTDTVVWIKYAALPYAVLQGSLYANTLGHNTASFIIGQNVSGATYFIWRSACRFSFSNIPTNVQITAATLKLYGHSDQSVDDFDITVVGGDFVAPPNTTDWSKGLTTDFGSKNTSTTSLAAYNNIAINAAGLVYLNAAIQTGEVELYVRSDFDISATAPTASEYWTSRGFSDANPPVLEVTYGVFGEDIYPETTIFPVTGRIDLATYYTISSYLTGIDDDLSVLADGAGNVDLAVANYIWWTGTSEILGYDNGTSRVTVTTLEATSGLTLDCDLVTADLTVTTTGTAVDSTVANDALLSNTAHASIKAKITDNEIAFDAIASATPADDEADIYMEIATGDLLIITRDDGQAGAKTDKLGDFSAM